MVEKELGIPFAPATVQLLEAATIGLSYVVASIVPLVSYFFLPIQEAFLASLVLAFVALNL
jgi:VIT1/CCC1 family predicted Fe2+/Mn2+ transporter